MPSAVPLVTTSGSFVRASLYRRYVGLVLGDQRIT
jgi:hypothetical protein